MRDLFDDFLEELRRREAVARGEDPDADAPRRPRPVDPDPGDDGPAQPRRRESGRGRRDGRRRPAWWVIGLVVLAVFLIFSFGLDLWTDALWFQSVGFDSVFWTRLTAQLGLFLAASVA